MLWLIPLVAVVAAFFVGYNFAPKGWRTEISNVLGILAAGLPAVVDYFANNAADLSVLFPPWLAPILLIIVKVANIFLREKTTTPPRGRLT